jgi:ABC-2 type transport system ATP-binding protein
VSQPDKAKELLLMNGYLTKLFDETLSIPFQSKEQVAEINLLLVSNNHKVYSLSQSQENLENLFLSITQ